MKTLACLLIVLFMVSFVLAQEAPTVPAWKQKVEKLKANAVAKMTQEQKDNFKKLQTDAAALKAKSEVTKEDKANLKADIINCLDTIKQPDPATIQKLAADLIKFYADGKISPDEIVKITEDVMAIMLSAGMTESDVEAIIKDIKVIVDHSNLTPEDLKLIANDLKAIVNTAKANKPK